MAYNGAKQPLVSGLVDPTPQINQKKALKRRRYHHCKSVPLADNVPQDLTLLRSEFILGKHNPSIQQVGIILGVYLCVGTICFFLVRHQIKGKKTNGMIDSLYLCINTMTTVGYGDLVPDSFPAKLFASVFSFSGMVLVGLILRKAANYLIEKQALMLVKALHMCQKVGLTESLKEIEASSTVGYNCVMVLIVNVGLMFIGMIFLASVEELDHIDAFYCVCSTITTLGFGDKSFQTAFGRFFAVFWILSSTTSLSHLFFYIVELYTETKQKALVKWVLTWRMANVDLETADVDDDGAVGAAEFAVYKLKEMGKISEEDISLAMKEFEDLDADQKGTFSVSDTTLAQPFETGR